MFRIRIYIILLGIYMLNVSLSAQAWIEGSSPEPKEPIWSVNNLPNKGIEIFFQLPGFYIIDLPNNKHSFKFPGSASILEEGNPELPQIARSINSCPIFFRAVR